MTPEEEQALTRFMLWSKLTTYAAIEEMMVGMNSDNEEVELWALNSLREFGKLLIRQRAEPGHQTGVQFAIDLMKKL